MVLVVDRKWKKAQYTISNLSIDGKWFSNALEDTDRGLKDSMPLNEIKRLKQHSTTAIPSGTYTITLDVFSPKYSRMPFYKEICNGKVPRLQNVKGFEGILIHVADGPKGAALLQGCIGVGYNTIKGGLTQGKKVFSNLYKLMLEAKLKGEELKIVINE